MNVVVLGNSKSGKTTYIASMYGMLQTPVNGFTLRATDESEHERLRELAATISTGDYPEMTSIRSSYEFELCHDDESFFEFNWVDYRGHDLMERNAHEGKAALLEHLEEADGVILLVDATEAHLPRTRTHIGAITNMLGNRLKDGDNKVLPICIAFTKCDLVDELPDAAFDNVLGLRNLIAASKRLRGAIISVACGPDADSVELPVLFVLTWGVIAMNNALVDEINASVDRVNHAAARAGLWDSFWSTINNEPSWRQIAMNAYERACARQRALEPIVGPMKGLVTMLSDIEVF